MDEVFDINGFTYISSKDLLKQAQPVSVDFKGFGFQISSNLNLAEGCSSCGTGTCG